MLAKKIIVYLEGPLSNEIFLCKRGGGGVSFFETPNIFFKFLMPIKYMGEKIKSIMFYIR